MFDEFNQPNKSLRDLLGVYQMELVEAKEIIRFEKQDLPFAVPLATWKSATQGKPVYGARSKAKNLDATVIYTFNDGSPALAEKKVHQGQVRWFGFLPGLTYLQPAIPKSPVDRGSTDEAMAHFIPSDTDGTVWPLLSSFFSNETPVFCSEKRVESSVIESNHGLVIPLINWSGEPVKDLNVHAWIKVPTGKVSLASGKPVKLMREDGRLVFVLDLDVADALILR